MDDCEDLIPEYLLRQGYRQLGGSSPQHLARNLATE